MLSLVVMFLTSCTPYRSYTYDQHWKHGAEAYDSGNCERAIGEMTKALEIAQAQQESSEPGKELIWGGDEYGDSILASASHALAYIYSKCGRPAEAVPLYKQAAALNEEVYGPKHRLIANNLNDLGVVYIALEQYDQAGPPLRQALDIYTMLDNQALEFSAKPSLNLGRVYRAQGRLAEAEAMFDRSLKAAEELYWSGTISGGQLKVHLEQYGALLHEMDRTKDAEELEARAKALTNGAQWSQ